MKPAIARGGPWADCDWIQLQQIFYRSSQHIYKTKCHTELYIEVKLSEPNGQFPAVRYSTILIDSEALSLFFSWFS